jgi:purine-binding chemotaxis protein CheW
VREVIELGPADVDPAPAFGTAVKVDFLLGMGKVGKRFVLLLDLDRVISADEKELARDAAAGALDVALDGEVAGAVEGAAAADAAADAPPDSAASAGSAEAA